MVSRKMTQKDIVDELNERTGFYKYNIRELLEALDDIIIENMNMAEYDKPSEIILFNGWRLGSKRVPERLSRDPRNQDEITSPEKLIPYCKLKQSFRQRLNKWSPEIDNEEDFTDDE